MKGQFALFILSIILQIFSIRKCWREQSVVMKATIAVRICRWKVTLGEVSSHEKSIENVYDQEHLQILWKVMPRRQRKWQKLRSLNSDERNEKVELAFSAKWKGNGNTTERCIRWDLVFFVKVKCAMMSRRHHTSMTKIGIIILHHVVWKVTWDTGQTGTF